MRFKLVPGLGSLGPDSHEEGQIDINYVCAYLVTWQTACRTARTCKASFYAYLGNTTVHPRRRQDHVGRGSARSHEFCFASVSGGI